MAQPNLSELLTTEELLAMEQMFTNAALMSALGKVFSYDRKVHIESGENEATCAEPNLNRMIQYATQARASKEWLSMVKNRLAALTPRQRGERG